MDNLRDELDAAFLYRVLAKRERDLKRSQLFEKLAIESEKQAKIWQGRAEAKPWSPRVRVRIVAGLIRILGPKAILPVLASMKVRGISVYSAGHTEAAESLRHRAMSGGGNLRAAVFGMNDGLLSNASLIVGVAAATDQGPVVLASGVAGLLAGSFSMAVGEYVSVRSQRELYENQMALERDELKEFPEEEAAELAVIYEAKGLPKSEAQSLANRMISDPEKALDALAREELGLNPEDLGSPIGAALSSFTAFAVGALIPLLPFLWLPDAQLLSIGLSALSLFGLGAGTSLFTGKGALRSGARMLILGLIAGSLTYAVGLWLGVSV